MPRPTKIIGGLLLTLFLLLLVTANGILLWVATGPRTLNEISPYIESSLSRPGQFEVHIGQTWLVWDGWKHPVDIRLRNVSVTTSNGQEFSTFPEISLGIHLLSLLQGQLLPSSLTLNKPVISLLQNPDRSISFGMKAPEGKASPHPQSEAAPQPVQAPKQTVPFAAVFMPLLMPDEASNFRKLRYISITHADLSVGSNTQGVFFTSADTNMIFRRSKRGIIHATLNADILYNQFHTPVEATLAVDKNGIEGNLTFSQLRPAVLAQLFSDNPHLKQLDLPVNGKAKLMMDLDGEMSKLSFILDGGKGTLSSPYLEETVTIEALHTEGQLNNNLKDIQIDTLTARLSGSTVTASGVVSLGNNDAAIRAKASISDVEAGSVRLFWPPSLAPKTREWVTTNITSGRIPQADVNINMAFGDMDKPVLPKESVDANIKLEAAEITYLKEHPPVKNIKGTIHVDGIALDAAIESAQYMDSTALSAGRVYIADLYPDNPYIEVDFDADTNATDMIRFLDLPRLKKAQKLKLDAASASGSVKGKAKVGFHFYAPLNPDGTPGEPDINYSVSAALTGMAQKKFMDKFDLYAIDGTLVINNQFLEFKGTGNVNGATVNESVVKYVFVPVEGPNRSYDTFINLKAATPVELLPRFGYPSFPFISGTISVDANVLQGSDIETATAMINLTDTSIQRDDIDWEKPAGREASLEITTKKTAGLVTIPSFRLKADGVDARGNASVSKEMDIIDFIWFTQLVFGETKLEKLNYESVGGRYKIEVQGDTLDISPWVEDDPESTQEPTFSFRHFPAIDLKANVSRLITRKGQELSAVKAELKCTHERCDSADISAMLAGQKPFTFRIFKNPRGIRQLSINADDAGALFTAFNLMDGMEGGVMGIVGDYNDSQPESVLAGKLFIGSHTVRDVPILAKLLSLASLTGIIDTLQGKGIQFDKLRAPFTLSNDVMTLKDAKTYGSAIGLTADGTITFPQRSMDLQGTVVPSYTLNNVLGKVPLIGTILTGGKGEGIIAARYAIKGTSSKPDISVNPLSMLTPGFLRGLFDILDAPAKSETTTPETKGNPETDVTPIPVLAPEKTQ